MPEDPRGVRDPVVLSPGDAEPPPPAEGAPSAAQVRFRSCRWSATGDDVPAEHCTHRDVLPFAGSAGFNPEAWCPTCAFYKARRVPKKRLDHGY